jgi:hypothetical protein
MKKLIAVCGSDGDDEGLKQHAMDVAEEVGSLIASKGSILLCGGKGGVMEAAARGAKKSGGITVGILPVEKSEANRFIDVPLPTKLGSARNFLIINSADAVIGICGRWGTMSEISFSMNIGKKTIVIKGTGGFADVLSSATNLPNGKPLVAKSAKEAVEMAMK